MKVMKYEVVSHAEEVPETLETFKEWEFSSGSTTGIDFDVFARLFKSAIRKKLPKGAELVAFSKGHYYVSGFMRRGDKFAYFSISDVRFFPGEWFKQILIRTAKSEKDYTGGGNGYTTLEDFTAAAERLL